MEIGGLAEIGWLEIGDWISECFAGEIVNQRIAR